MSGEIFEVRGVTTRKYVHKKELGSGGCARVYLAQDDETKEDVAVKIFFHEMKNVDNEIRALGSMNHPHIVSLLHNGMTKNGFSEAFCLVMPFVDGKNLGEYIEDVHIRYKADAQRLLVLLGVIWGIMEAVKYAHGKKIVHRDLKPQNIIVTAEGHPCVLDFNVAHIASNLTQQSVFTQGLGTPSYMAPEQFPGSKGQLNHRCDVWALGILLYEALEKRQAFKEQNQVCREDEYAVPQLTKYKFLQELITISLQQQSEKRYADVAQFQQALQEKMKQQLTFSWKKSRQKDIKEWQDLDETIYQDRDYWQKILPVLRNTKKIAHLAEIPTLIYGVVSSPAFVTVGLENANKIAKKSLDKKAILEILTMLCELWKTLQQENLSAYLERATVIANESESEKWQFVAGEWLYNARGYASATTGLAAFFQKYAQQELCARCQHLLQPQINTPPEEWLRSIKNELNVDLPYPYDECEKYLRQGPVEKAIEVTMELTQIMESTVAASAQAKKLLPLVKSNPSKTPEGIIMMTRSTPEEKKQLLATENPIANWEITTARQQKQWIYVCENSKVITKLRSPKPQLHSGFSWETDAEGREWIICEKDGQQLAYVPAGKFWIGCTYTDYSNAPLKEVYLDAYMIGRYPVTNAQYAKFLDDEGHKQEKYWQAGGFKEFGKQLPGYWNDKRFNVSEHPVVGVSWYEAQAYCNWAGLLLATEAQWTKAARGGIYLDGDEKREKKNPLPQRKFPWGDELPNADKEWRANYYKEPKYGNKQTSPIGSFPKGASPYGCLDMSGNTWEWCMDSYSRDYFNHMESVNPSPCKTGNTSVLLGGSWCSVDGLAVSYRRNYQPACRVGRVGFRASGLTF